MKAVAAAERSGLYGEFVAKDVERDGVAGIVTMEAVDNGELEQSADERSACCSTSSSVSLSISFLGSRPSKSSWSCLRFFRRAVALPGEEERSIDGEEASAGVESGVWSTKRILYRLGAMR